MNVKTDTKEIFTVITPTERNISANMSAGIEKLCLYIEKDIPHLVIDMQMVEEIDIEAAKKLATVQQKFYENEKSFVVCCLTKNVEEKLNNLELLDIMNITPTESEAWDIVQMEEIERALMKDF